MGPADRVARPAGMADILPEECARWVRAEAVVREVMRRFGLGEIRFPVIEPDRAV
jgi:histidyl-tRNA synthetase